MEHVTAHAASGDSPAIVGRHWCPINRMRVGWCTLVSFIICAAPARADVAPITYEGMTLRPIARSEVEMVREHVRIRCAETTCQVDARFWMNNATQKPVEVYVGFPVGEFMMDNWDYDFRVEAGGAKVTRFKRAKSEVVHMRGIEVETEWFGWLHRFPPGDSTIEVRYRVQPSPSYYNRYSQNIYYVLDSGSFWKGTIGRGVVEVAFLDDVDPRQIVRKTTTPGFTLAGRTVSWRFENLEPTRDDNLRLEILPHAIFDRLEALRAQIRDRPADPTAKIDLARHLFPLGFHKGVTFYLPLQLTPAEYRATLATIGDADDKKFFVHHYVRRPCPAWVAELPVQRRAELENEYRESYRPPDINGDPESYWKLVKVLAAVDFLPPGRDAVSEYAERGQKLLEEVLAANPTNADAWLLFLSNYYRFKFSGYAPRYLAKSPMQPRQIAAIERAAQHCPKHPGIALWRDLARAYGDNAKWQAAADRLTAYNEKHQTYAVPWLPESQQPRDRFPGLGIMGRKPVQ